ncbi:MAG: phosphate uptake regulator PhoU [Candidatus Thermoplasmatota archaeon]|jgi:phosphate uptake regulator|nr:phosphate uptake regulator PhoU [Candidatus Thermoplasmatota archaeon]MDP7265053.1 phosphate uptake regulator PhoU [Candidatus Thermoplasmatota archaeon]
METRKVQITGGNTYIVSLPKKWVHERGIKSGDPLKIIPQRDGTLVVEPDRNKKKEVHEKTFTVDGDKPSHLLRKLIGAYISGYTVINLNSKERFDPQLRKTVREFSRIVIGPEIIEESMKNVVIQDFIDPSELSMAKGTKRMYLITKGMHQDALTALEEKDADLALDVKSRDAEVDRLYYLISKQFSTLLRNPRPGTSVGYLVESHYYLLLARLIERIADHACKMAVNITRIEEVVDPELVRELSRLSSVSIGIIDAGMKGLVGKDVNEANKGIEVMDELKSNCDDLFENVKNMKSDLAVSLAYIIESILRTGFYGVNVCETAINYLISREDEQ